MDPRFLEYYNRELRYLRELGGEFAQDFPKIASRLGLDSFACADPYVERLLEGFAFLAARVQLKIDGEFPRFTEHLLDAVCPNYVAPTPSMTVVQMTPDEQQGGLNDGFVIPRGTSLRGGVRREVTTACTYRTAHEVTLWPIELVSVSLAPITGAPPVDFTSNRRQKSSLRLHLRTTNGMPFSRLPMRELTLFFRGSDSVALRLFEQCVGGTIGLASRPRVPNAPWKRLEGGAVRPVGLEDSEALLPCGARTFQGYRLLHEYFAFPSRFLFAKFDGIASGITACESSEIELLAALDRHDPGLESAATSGVTLFCTPAINLFPKRADRIHLTDRDYEYQVVPDRARPLDFEVHTVLGATAFGAKGELKRTFAPFYRMGARATDHDDAAFFTVQRRERTASLRQRERAIRSNYLGNEVFIALVDGREGPFHSELRQLSVETLSTNRDLPILMPVGEGITDFEVESGAPVKVVRCIAGPSPPTPSQAVGESSWRLISHLSLNYLALTEGTDGEGASALRELLSLYANLSDFASQRQISGLRSAATHPVVRRLPLDGPPCFARGMEITVDCDETAFEGTSVFVLSMVLARFFARYVSINSFVETVMRTSQRGEIARWPMNIGRRPAI